MARHCNACGRSIPDEHDVLGTATVLLDRGPIPGRKQRIYRCRVRKITNDTAYDFLAGGWVPGERRVPDSMQRTARNPARYIHVDSLKAVEREERSDSRSA